MKEIIISILLTIILTTVSMSFIFNHFIKSMQSQINEMSFWVYKMIDLVKKTENNTTDISIGFHDTYSNISKLSNNVATYLTQEKQRRESTFIMPKPDLSAIIDQTIKEQIIIEATLAKNMRIPAGDLLDRIILNVEKTYPDVDKEYLSKKVLVRVEEFNETAQNK